MPTPLPFEPHRFRSAAAHYLAGRPPYPSALIARVAQVCGLRPTDRVMDLGCGPGQLARAFAPLAAEIIGIDPEPEMLQIATAESAAFRNITWRQASSYDLSPALGEFGLVCMGRSFHWMDRADTLRRLDEIIEPGGAVVLFSDEHPALPDNGWYQTYRDVLGRYADDDHTRARRKTGEWMRHESVLLESDFCRLETVGVIERHSVTIETLVDRALSLSSTSRVRLEGRADTMIAELREALAGSTERREVILSKALIAWRS